MKKISIVIPAKDEENTIGLVLNDIKQIIKKTKKYSWETIVINDGSTDKTEEIAKSYGNWVTVINNNSSIHGKGIALQQGFKAAKGDYIVMLDADYSHRPEDIPKFIEKLEEGAKLVIGSRHLGGSEEYTLTRAIGNHTLTFIFRIMFRQYLTDVLNGFKAFPQSVVKKYKYDSQNFEIEIELITNAIKEGGPILEIPSHERKRAGGKMKSHAIREGYKFLKAIITYGIKYRRSQKKQ